MTDFFLKSPYLFILCLNLSNASVNLYTIKMGNRINAILNRIFDYPIKRKPICFYRQQDFASTGEPLPVVDHDRRGPQTEYDKLVDSFYTKLLDHRSESREFHEKNRRWSMQNIVSKYPGWDDMTISNLHNLFLLFDNNLNGMLNFEDLSALLESLGDENTTDIRREKFDEADSDSNGWINYDEFLSLVYNFDSPQANKLNGLGKLCYDVAENIKFVSSLSVGEQLEYGLF